MGSAQADVLDLVAAARAEGFDVADDGSVTGGATSPLLVALSGGSPAVTCDVLTARDRGGARPARCGRRRHRPRHRRGVEPTARAAAPTVPAGAWPVPPGRRRRGLVGDRPGPDRKADRLDDPGTAATPHRRIPQAGRQHRRRALGDADRGQPGQYRAGDRRRTPRGQAGVARAHRVLPGTARRRSTTRPEPAAGSIARSSRSIPTGHR